VVARIDSDCKVVYAIGNIGLDGQMLITMLITRPHVTRQANSLVKNKRGKRVDIAVDKKNILKTKNAG